MLRPAVRAAWGAAPRGAHFPSRTLATLPPILYRQQPDRLPPGHVRPRRKPYVPGEPSTAPGYPPPPPPSGVPFHEYDAYDPSTSPVTAPSRPVTIPYDSQGVLQDSHAARQLLGHDTLVIVRQIEMLNVFMGFEQANRYAIHTPEGELVGFLAEEERSFLATMSRQALRTHRPFRAVVMDRTGSPILWINRPFAFINSRIFVRESEGEGGKLVGEAQQEWHPWRRRYNVFQTRESETFQQFAKIDSGLLAWDFWLKDKDDRLVASINRNFRGLGRELFTDTGQYVIRFDSAGTELDLPPGSDINVQGQKLVLPEGREGGLTLDQRAMTLATAVSIDFDYFSRHSGAGGMGFPFMMWGGGDGSSDVNHGRPDSGVTDGAATGAAAGAAGATLDGGGEASDEEMYGRPATGAGAGSDQPAAPPEQAGEYPPGGYEEQGWGEEWTPDDDQVMQDPWGMGQSGGDSWFGGGGGGGDGGGFGGWD